MRGSLGGHFARLGLTTSASEQQVQNAFRALAKRHHPDKHASDAAKARAESLFKDISASYRRICEARGYKVPGGSAGPADRAQQRADYEGFEWGAGKAQTGRASLIQLAQILLPPGVLVGGFILWGTFVVSNSSPPSGVVRAGSVTKYVPNSETEQALQPILLDLHVAARPNPKRQGFTDD
mmetsp:Transcript_768/g.2064  ORF Transcript_768/g.2064 Transcript_768/m.2064 type:complete len:181 (+) Transcript_768:78-620(+)